MVETIGVMATLFVLMSFLCTDERSIRLINIIGAALFVAYGLLLGALSVWALNLALIVIHIFYLTRK